MINKEEILRKYSRREVTPEEHQAFRQWLQTLTPQEVDLILDDYGDIVAGLPTINDPANAELLTSVHQSINKEEAIIVNMKARHRKFNWRWAVAAAIILAVSTLVFILDNNRNQQPDNTTQTIADLPPGKSGAILTLADGTQLVLDSLGNGVIASQNGSETILENGKLIYNTMANGEETFQYNVMSTPKGRQFNVVLPDGTIVWLNAASSIRYPTVFKGNQRNVSVTGEAYFEVARNAKMPFIVNANNKAQIEVLGTHFNVDAYDNNATLIATLLEGSIKVNGTLIKPGQQAQISDAVHVINADTSKVMAWKHGLFNFDGVKLEEVMKQLERWYDIEVVYEKGIPNIAFGGEMTKNISLSGLLLVLEKSDIHFRLEGRKLIVLP